MNVTPRTIAVVAPYFPPHSGGLERYAFEVATLLRENHDSRIIVITSGEKGNTDVKEEKNGFTMYRLGYQAKISNTPFAFSWITKVRRILRDEKPDVVHIHTPVPGIGDIAAFFARAPVVVTYHASTMRKGNRIPDTIIWLYEKLALPFLLWKAETIVCASDFIRDGFLSRYKQKSITLTPGVHSELFIEKPEMKTSHPSILFVAGRIGRTDVYKGLDTLLDSMEILSKKMPEARLVVVGDGDLLSEYETRAERLAPGTVTFTGTLHGESLANEFQKAHVLAHPSRNESFGMVILEAMATGLPVVGTRVGGIPSLVKDGETGFLIEPSDAAALAEKLELLLSNPSLSKKFGANGRARAVSEFDWAARAIAYDEIFRSLTRPLIVQVVGYYPPHVGGMERVTETLAEMLAKENYRVSVLTSNGTLKGNTEHKGNLTVERLASFEFAHTPIAPTLPWHLFTLPKHSRIHLHLSQAFWPELILLISKIRGIPYIVHMHLDVAPSGRLGPLFLVYKKVIWGPVLRNATHVIACSNELANLAERTYSVPREQITVIVNAVSEQFFSDRVYRSTHGSIKLLSIGRLAAQKKTERLIDMMTHISVPAELIIAGDGEDREALETMAREKKLLNVAFVGMQDDAGIQKLHAAADIFLIASDREGRALAVLEAMAAGLPVVASDVEGNHELVNGVGVLVSSPSGVAFAKVIDTIAQDSTTLSKLSLQSKAKAKSAGWGNFMTELTGVYSKIL